MWHWTRPTNTKSGSTFHSEDCFCGGQYATRDQDQHSPNNADDIYQGAYYPEDDYRHDDDRIVCSSPSPSLVDAGMPAPRSISITDTPPLLPSTPVVNALEAPSASTTRTQRPLPNHLTCQVPHYNSASTTASFYYHDVHKHNLSRGVYSADAYYARARSKMKDQKEKHDPFLMLYRDPPSWSVLETVTSNAAPNTGNLAISSNAMDRNRTEEGVKKKDADKLAALAALRIAATRRVPVPSHVQTISPFPTSTPSRNPFRREISEIKQNDSLQGPQLLSQSHRQDISRIDSSVKPLKPISAVKIPPLPSGLWHQSSSSPAPTTTTKQMKIRHEMNEVGACGSSGNVAVTAPATLVAAKMKPREKINMSTLKRSTSMGRIKPDHSEVGSTNLKKDAKRQRRSFDWSGWATPHGK